MTLNKAIQILNEVIPPSTHNTVDLEHLPICQAWECVKQNAIPFLKARWMRMDDPFEYAEINENGEVQESAKCSYCGEWLVASDEYPVVGNFCPNCGAYMREE